MIETIYAKIGAFLLDALKWAWVAIIGLLVHIYNGHRKRIDGHGMRIGVIEKDVSEMKSRVVYQADLDAKADEIKAEVKHEHQRIIDEQIKSNHVLRDELVTCNQNVMSHISTMRDDIREVRSLLMSVLDRRKEPR